jgi:putative membrane protein
MATAGRSTRLTPLAGFDGPDRLAYTGIFGLGGLLSWLCRVHPALLPLWAPWDFSWMEFLAITVGLWWFLRGLAHTERSERVSIWRCVCFLSGLAAIYAVLQTRFDYVAQHMFFLNRVQHVVMHHIGPFLIAIAGVGAIVRRGMPRLARDLMGARPVSAAMRVLQQPVIAVVLFVGLFYLWLIPTVHFRAMIDPRLYALMNWSMVLDGLLFWPVVLDNRPRPPARLSFGVRGAIAYATAFPEFVIGFWLTSADRDLYPYYELCGRLFPSISAMADQRIGGIVSWVLPAMMSAAAALLVFCAFVRNDETPSVPTQVATRN